MLARVDAARIAFNSSDSAIAARWNRHGVSRAPIRAAGNENPLAAIEAVEAELRRARRGEPRYRRWSGFVAYEANRWIESLPPTRPIDWPTASFWPTGKPAAFAATRMERSASASLVRRSLSRDDYVSRVRRAIAYIAAGDVFQVNLAQAFDVSTSLSPAEVWQRLQSTPAAYGAFIDLGDAGAILSNSPELFFRVQPLADGRRRITTRPIKGTRPRGLGMRDELERSEKDKAELAMIVDLERNDLGRICEIGSVRVVEPRVIEEHPTVYHGVATIEGFLCPDVTLADVFRAMFPCGSITGCPKVRAMEIIDELEGQPRGPYCGAIGYVDADGSAEFSVAIRTMTLANGVARVSVGGGIVADSDPDDEYRETIDKARAMLSALGMTREQIDALRAE